VPTYDYQCNKCGHRWELFQSIKARPIRKCPACAQSAAQRLIGTGGGVIFRGSGFYQTDYRSDGYKKAAKAEKEAVSGTGGDKKSDGKVSTGSASSDGKGGAASSSSSSGSSGRSET